jgi:hypothetical protein
MRLIKVLETQINESEAGSYEISEQRERNHRYTTLQPLGNEQRGRSHYIDPSVLDSVESKKALFSETFLSNRQTVKFKTGGGQIPHEADAKTAYAMQTLRANKHERLFRDGWHDAFVAKRMVVACWWKKDTKDITLSIQGANVQQVQQLIAQQGEVMGIDESQLDIQQLPTPTGQTVPIFSGSLTITIDDSACSLELIQPERFYRDPLASYPEDSQWCTYERSVPRGTLVLEGYDEDQIMGLDVDYRFRSESEDSSRKAHDASWTRRAQKERKDNQQEVTVFKTWTWCNLAEEYEDRDLELGFQPEDKIALYEIHWASGEILKFKDGSSAIMPAEEIPFFEWCEMKISHAEFGLCTADIMAHTQKTQSTLKRLIIDNQQMRNNTRYEAVIGALKNPRDLLDSTIGGVVWSRSIGSVAPLAAPELSPLTMGVIQLLQQDGERRDGYSSLGKGMNGDAVRYQNAADMVERLTAAGTRRPMTSARDWALTFLVPLCQYIVTLGIRNDKSKQQLEVGGRIIPIIPAEWSDDDLSMDVAVALTPQEGKEHAQMLMLMHQTMMTDPELATIYKVQQKHALMDAVFDSLGVSDSTPYMMRPDSPEYQQAMQQQQQMMMDEKEKADSLVKLNAQIAQSTDRREWDKAEWQKTQDMEQANREERKLAETTTNNQRKLELGWAELAQKNQIEQSEVFLEDKQRRPVGVGN